MPVHPLLKPRRIIDRKYREWIKTHRCWLYSVACCGPIDPHHVIPKGGGKMGSKVSDYRCLPVCRYHHEIVAQHAECYRDGLEAAILRYNALYQAEVKPRNVREKKSLSPTYTPCVKCSKCKTTHKLRDRSWFLCRGVRKEL